jgi:hypothetical protein
MNHIHARSNWLISAVRAASFARIGLAIFMPVARVAAWAPDTVAGRPQATATLHTPSDCLIKKNFDVAVLGR